MSVVRDNQRPKTAWPAVGIVAVFFVWLGLFATGLTTTAVEALRPFLPTWSPTVNLILIPVLLVLSAASSRIQPEIRLLIWVLTLCSASALYLSYKTHRVAYFLVIILLFGEAFFVIPRWNRHRRRKLGLALRDTATAAPKSTTFDYIVYVVVGLTVALCLIYATLSRR